MFISEIRVGLSTTHNLGNYNSVTVEASITANLKQEDDVPTAVAELQMHLAAVWDATYQEQESRFPGLPRKRDLMRD